MELATDSDMQGVMQVILGPSPPRPAGAPGAPSARVQRNLATEMPDIAAMVRSIEVPPMSSPAPVPPATPDKDKAVPPAPSDKGAPVPLLPTVTEMPPVPPPPAPVPPDPMAAVAAPAPEDTKKRGSPASAPEEDDRNSKKAKIDVRACIQGDTFVDKMGIRYSKAEQTRRVKQWLKGWDKDAPSHVALCLQKMWLQHGTKVFSSGELRYHSEKKRYVSARGLCNGHEVKGFPALVPVDINKSGRIMTVRFSDVLSAELLQRRPRYVVTAVKRI